MEIYLTDETALDFWNTLRFQKKAGVALAKGATSMAAAHVPCFAQEEIEALHQALRLRFPLHVTVPCGNARRNTKTVICHVRTGLVDRPLFAEVMPGVHVELPECALLRLSKHVDKICMLKWVNAWCGTYSISNGNYDTIYNMAPLASIASITRFTSGAGKDLGTRDLVWASQNAFDNAASPQEGGIGCSLTLTRHYGGYSHIRPEINREIAVAGGVYKPDFYWEKYNFAIEYDSWLCHSSEDKKQADALRRIAIETMGIHVITPDPSQFRTVEKFDQISAIVAKYTGQTPTRVPPDYKRRKIRLQRALL